MSEERDENMPIQLYTLPPCVERLGAPRAMHSAKFIVTFSRALARGEHVLGLICPDRRLGAVLTSSTASRFYSTLTQFIPCRIK